MSKEKQKHNALVRTIATILFLIGVLGILFVVMVPNFIAYRKSSFRSGKNPYMAAQPYYPEAAHQPPPAPVAELSRIPQEGRVQQMPIRLAARRMNTEEYDRIYDNRFKNTLDDPLSTFSIDVDTASYSNVRRFINGGRLPPEDAVRIEEMINYFSYSYPEPRGGHPFSITTEISLCPWHRGHRLVHIGLQGKRSDAYDLPPSNLVFLIDTSGSMSPRNKLPLLIRSLDLLLPQLGEQDRIAIVTYAGSAGLVLPSTRADGSGRYRIREALGRLRAGGSTAGGAGIELAYKVARDNFIPGGNNRVILATDGDFNVGVSSTGALVRMIEEKRKNDIYLSICGFGMGNLKDGRMEGISNAGNGNYFYIDSLREAEKVFSREMRANLYTIAKDVKIQIEFNPSRVSAYRLVGYENRLMAAEDFHDDTKDAGELGAGHTVTALYEVVPAGKGKEGQRRIDPLRYQEKAVKSDAARGEEIMLVKLRYKAPRFRTSRLLEIPVLDRDTPLHETSEDFRFSAAVAGFGMLLRHSGHRGHLTYDAVMDLARGAMGVDEGGYRREFLSLVEICARMAG